MADVEKHKRLSPADRARLGGQLEQAYTQGASLASLAASHRTSAGRLRLMLLERGVVLRRPGGSTRRPDPGRLERAQVIARDYAAGATLAQLGSTHRIVPATVRNLVLAAGGQMRARGARTPRPDGDRPALVAPARLRAHQGAGRCDEQEHRWRRIARGFSAALEVSMHLWWQHSN